MRQRPALPPGRDRAAQQDVRLLHGGIDTPGLDQIGSPQGNKVSADCSYYIDNQLTVAVPIWDIAGGTGQNGWYHVGYTGFQLTNCTGGKDVEGV